MCFSEIVPVVLQRLEHKLCVFQRDRASRVIETEHKLCVFQ